MVSGPLFFQAAFACPAEYEYTPKSGQPDAGGGKNQRPGPSILRSGKLPRAVAKTSRRKSIRIASENFDPAITFDAVAVDEKEEYWETTADVLKRVWRPHGNGPHICIALLRGLCVRMVAPATCSWTASVTWIVAPHIICFIRLFPESLREVVLLAWLAWCVLRSLPGRRGLVKTSDRLLAEQTTVAGFTPAAGMTTLRIARLLGL